MKIAAMLVIAILLFAIVMVTGCVESKDVSKQSSASEPSDEEVLAQYPDDLDAALEELEMVE
ncbi:MAG: hypothetical protein AABY40_02215 [Nanoarchaeota archaeon]